eukprot:7730-Heterococcus_DN1.PRE.5
MLTLHAICCYCCYCYYCCNSPAQNEVNAVVVLLESVQQYCWNWSAWLDLAEVALQFDVMPEVSTTLYTTYKLRYVAVRNGGCSSLYCFGRHSGQCDAAVAYDYPAQHTQANGSSSTAALYRSLSSQVTTLHQHCGQADSTAWELDTLQVAAPYMHNLESVTDTAYKRADVDSSGYSVRSLSIQLDTAA